MTTFEERQEKNLEARARRAAKAAGLVARKSRWRANSVDNHGGFMIVDPCTGFPEAGFRYDLTAEEVIAYFTADGVSFVDPEGEPFLTLDGTESVKILFQGISVYRQQFPHATPAQAMAGLAEAYPFLNQS